MVVNVADSSWGNAQPVLHHVKNIPKIFPDLFTPLLRALITPDFPLCWLQICR